ncbi:uncharacterized protein DNG_07175 [Cephalotrichum gorgonifer]|uniref:Peptidase A1 domain-containing protein n=1 Tax=Cephalotrichum gorgonifer TaxID=2041049 RepID=A0AAE8N153_9PEZI|nr:uncharacterized protein DNG_07175 [Cephalotrichum gorgonifer]
MTTARFFTSLLTAAGAAAYIHAPLSPPKLQAFETLARELTAQRYPNQEFVGNIPWYPYAIDVGVGTPAQTQSLVLSLAHSDTYVLYHDVCDPNSNPDSTRYLRNCSSGSYDEETSTTFSQDYYHEYSDDFAGIGTYGVMVGESLSIGDTEFSNVSLAVAMKTSLDTGFLGLSIPRKYVDGKAVDRGTSILDQMVSQEVVESPAFSIYAEEGRNSTTGGILFGAVDKSKYDGELRRIQASVARDKFENFEANYLVNVSAAWKRESRNDELSQYVSPDMGETAFYGRGGTFYAAIDLTFLITNVPAYVAYPIYMMGGGFSQWHNIDMWTVDCDGTGDLNGTFSLELGGEGGYRLTANLRDLIVPPEQWHLLRPAKDGSGERIKHCLFGIQSSKSEYFHYDGSGWTSSWVIGSMLLRNTYTVFDSKNMEVSLAPLRKNPSEKGNIVPFGSSGAHAPDSELIGYQECFPDGCEAEEEDEDAGAHIVMQKGLLVGLVLGALWFVSL